MRLRLILSFIFIVIIATVSVALIARRQTVNAVNAFIFRGGLSGTDGLVTNLEEYYATRGSWEGVGPIFQHQGRGMGTGLGQNRESGLSNQRLQLADSDKRVLIDTRDENPDGYFDRTEWNRAIKLTVDGQVVGYLLPEVSFQINNTATQALVSRINQAAITAAILVSGVALILALFLSYRLLRPVVELTQAAKKMAGGDLSQRVPVRGDDELATLATTFNLMAESLQMAETRRRALTADIAHELRTPLAVQRAHIEALEDGIYYLTLDSLKPIEEHNHLLTRLVEDLRMLALADSGQLDLVRAPVDLTALVKRVLARIEPQTTEQQIQIVQAYDGSQTQILLDAQRIEQIIHILLDNAIRYTPDGGVIRVQCSIDNDISMVSIHDSGLGIPAEDLTRIFERFYRGEKARSRADGGTGLGLSIARKIAQAHGGDLTAENHQEGGAVFTLILPGHKSVNH